MLCWQQMSLRVYKDMCDMLLYPLRQGVEGTDLFDISVRDHSFFWESQGKVYFVPSLFIASTIDSSL